MKVHYINILLFALPLDILVYNQRKHMSTTPHTQANRSLCECDLYMPNYDNDPQMKKIMENFNKQTQQRFHEYDDRMKTTRQKCKDRCDKEIQKIILKDKLEKELMDKFATLQTDIQSDAIPTCVCEKSIADKVEKGCLKCGGILGTAFPEFGLIGGNFVHAAAVNAATKAGIAKAIELLEIIPGLNKLIGSEGIAKIVTPLTYNKPQSLFEAIFIAKKTMCVGKALTKKQFCVYQLGGDDPIWYVGSARQAAEEGAEAYISTLSDSTTIASFLTHPIVISAIVIVTIAVILLIIYLILRYRRKKKMNKKMQYIKLLEE